jgi:hypothetical protein
MPVKKKPSIYQIRVELQGSRPPIWRRFQVSPDITLPRLHRALQIVMGWEDYHLHEFRRGERTYAEPDPEDDHFGRKVADERRVRLKTLLPDLGSSCEYIYDFGDDWTHHITLESILPPVPRKFYPVCVAGERSAPPEDSGGINGYERYLTALFDPQHEDHLEMRQWRGRFAPERFSGSLVNRRLKEEFPSFSRIIKSPARPTTFERKDSTAL